MSQKLVLLTGCSGGGKSTLLNALGTRGFHTVLEPGRRIVAEELAGKGTALPWVDMKAFALRAFQVAKSDLEGAKSIDNTVFFDRGMIDAAVALADTGGPTIRDTHGQALVYDKRVFVAPPWRALCAQDAERRHSFESAVEEYHRIVRALDALGYDRTELPQVSVQERVEFVLQACGAF